MTRPIDGDPIPFPQGSRGESGGGRPPTITAVGGEYQGEPAGHHPVFIDLEERIRAYELPPFSQSLYRVLQLAEQEATAAGDSVLGLPHVFLGLLQDRSVTIRFAPEVAQNVNFANARSILIGHPTKEPPSIQERVIVDARIAEVIWRAAESAHYRRDQEIIPKVVFDVVLERGDSKVREYYDRIISGK